MNEIATKTTTPVSPYLTESGFALAQRAAKSLAASTLVPKDFQGAENVPNCLIALEYAHRLKASPLLVMQSMYVIHGRPSFAASFMVAMVNASGKFSPIAFQMSGAGDDKTCIAYAANRETGEVVEGPPVSIRIAKAEGWYSRKGSKWQTMPDLMLRYRAATFFARLYAPEVLLGMQTHEEYLDAEVVPTPTPAVEKVPAATGIEALKAKMAAARGIPAEERDDEVVVDPPEPPPPEPPVEHAEAAEPPPAPEQAGLLDDEPPPAGPTVAEVSKMLDGAQTVSDVEEALGLVKDLEVTEKVRTRLKHKGRERMAALQQAAAAAKAGGEG